MVAALWKGQQAPVANFRPPEPKPRSDQGSGQGPGVVIHKRQSDLLGSDGSAHLQRQSLDSAGGEGRTDPNVVQGVVKYRYHRENFLNDSENLTEGQEKVVEGSSEFASRQMPTQAPNSEVQEGRQVKETPPRSASSRKC